MERLHALVISLFVIQLVIGLAIVAPSDSRFNSAQTDMVATGELLPNPYFSVEPAVEIGHSSPEFDYEYLKTGDVGKVSLIWSHTAGYQPVFSDFGLPLYDCAEYARVSQQFEWVYDQIPTAMRISASIEVSCIGDFSTEDNLNEFWELEFLVGVPGYSVPYQFKVLTDLESNDIFDVEFLLSNYELYYAFYGSVEYPSGGQLYPNDVFTLFIGLSPTYKFILPTGEDYPWNLFSGSVIVSIDHMSADALLEAPNQSPAMIQPRANVTELWNDTYVGYRIESAGYDALAHLSGSDLMHTYQWEMTIGMLNSDFQSQWIKTYTQKPSETNRIVDFAIRNNRIVALGQYSNYSILYGIQILSLDIAGNSLWNKTVTPTGLDYAIRIDLDTSGNAYILMLSLVLTGQYELYELDYGVINIDNQGNVLWNKTVATVDYEPSYIGYIPFPTGFGCADGGFYLSIEGEMMRFNSLGERIWSKRSDDHAMCVDPFGGCYIFSNQYFKPILSKWTAEGNVQWERQIFIDYGEGWSEYPTLQNMIVGPTSSLYLVLVYEHVNPTMTIAQVDRNGQIISHDSIIENCTTPENYYQSPTVLDMAVTGDGQVHLAIQPSYLLNNIYYPLYPANFNTILSFQLPVPMTFSPLSIAMIGLASIIFLGIALDYFVLSKRRLKVPEVPSVPEFEW